MKRKYIQILFPFKLFLGRGRCACNNTLVCSNQCMSMWRKRTMSGCLPLLLLFYMRVHLRDQIFCSIAHTLVLWIWNSWIGLTRSTMSVRILLISACQHWDYRNVLSHLAFHLGIGEIWTWWGLLLAQQSLYTVISLALFSIYVNMYIHTYKQA